MAARSVRTEAPLVPAVGSLQAFRVVAMYRLQTTCPFFTTWQRCNRLLFPFCRRYASTMSLDVLGALPLRLRHALSENTSATVPDPPPSTRFSSISIIGAPNAGKSTLLNHMVGVRVAAVSRKVNTTRRRIIGLYTTDNVQLAFCDTPGIVERRFMKDVGAVRRHLSQEAWGSAADSDVAVLVIDASRPARHWKRASELANQLIETRANIGASEKSLMVVLNKIDKVCNRLALMDMSSYLTQSIQDYGKHVLAGRCHVVSAFNGKGVEELREDMLRAAKPGRFLSLDVSPAALEETRDICVEHIWEKMLHCIHQEIPYGCDIQNDIWTEDKSGAIHLTEIIRVPRRSQIAIVVGQHGGTIKWIAAEASKSVSEVVQRPVHIQLRVALAKQ